MREYVLVATTYQAVEVYRRTAEAWTYQAYGPDDVIELAGIEATVPVAALYRSAGVPVGTDDPEGEV